MYLPIVKDDDISVIQICRHGSEDETYYRAPTSWIDRGLLRDTCLPQTWDHHLLCDSFNRSDPSVAQWFEQMT